MKKGISYWAYRNRTYAEVFEHAKNCGFDGVEVTLNDSGELTMDTDDKAVLAIKKQAMDSGIELYSVATGLHWGCPLTSNDKSVREKAKNIVRRELEVAELLGCDSVLVVPGLVSEDVPYDIAYNRALEAMCELAPEAQKHGVFIGVENVWNKFLLSPLEYRGFIDQVGAPYVKAYFDVGNVVYDGWPEQWIRILGDRICKIHIKDYVRDNRTISGFCDLGKGDINFENVLCALNEVGYESFCTAEVFPADTESDLEAAEKSAEFYKKIFA